MPDKPLDQLGLVQLHLGWYPLMEPRDVYKLLYQGIMGAEHLLNSAVEFTRQLASEFERVRADRLERLLEPVRPDHTLWRLNLRSYKSRHLQVDALYTLLLEASRVPVGDQLELRAAWKEFVASCEHNHLQGFKPSEIHSFTAWLEKSGYPAVHHSQVYRQQYQPAYRLITDPFIQALGLGYAG